MKYDFIKPFSNGTCLTSEDEKKRNEFGYGCGSKRGIAFITYITIVCDTFDAYITYTYRMKMA